MKERVFKMLRLMQPFTKSNKMKRSATPTIHLWHQMKIMKVRRLKHMDIKASTASRERENNQHCYCKKFFCWQHPNVARWQTILCSDKNLSYSEILHLITFFLKWTFCSPLRRNKLAKANRIANFTVIIISRQRQWVSRSNVTHFCFTASRLLKLI